jgi:hypothetical protein
MSSEALQGCLQVCLQVCDHGNELADARHACILASISISIYRDASSCEQRADVETLVPHADEVHSSLFPYGLNDILVFTMNVTCSLLESVDGLRGLAHILVRNGKLSVRLSRLRTDACSPASCGMITSPQR